LELKADESARTLVGQNSTQKPQDLQRSTTISTRPFATKTPTCGSGWHFQDQNNYGEWTLQPGVTIITVGCEARYKEKGGWDDAQPPVEVAR
jgi:hypothetical protein